MNRKQKNELLDYAIERINQYDDHLCKPTAVNAILTMTDCNGCSMALNASGCGDDYCDICPFAITDDFTHPCRATDDRSVFEISPKKHQSILIKAVKSWCKKFYPEYTVVRC